jgi:hypothetical protein
MATFLFMIYLHVLPIFNRFQVIRSFNFGCDFPTGGEIWVVWGENDPQKVKISKNTCLEGALPCVRPRLLSHCA